MISYAKAGGKLILDSLAALHFKEVLEAEVSYSSEQELIFLDGGNRMCALETPILEIIKDEAKSGDMREAGSFAETGYYYPSNIYEGEKKTAAFKQKLGEGLIEVICVDVGRSFDANRCGAYNDFICSQLSASGFESIVKVEGSKLLDVILQKREDTLIINLVNMAGNHNVAGIRTYSEIPKLGPLKVSVDCEQEPAEVFMEPGHLPAVYSYADGVLEIKVPELVIHQAITVR